MIIYKSKTYLLHRYWRHTVVEIWGNFATVTCFGEHCCKYNPLSLGEINREENTSQPPIKRGALIANFLESYWEGLIYVPCSKLMCSPAWKIQRDTDSTREFHCWSNCILRLCWKKGSTYEYSPWPKRSSSGLPTGVKEPLGEKETACEPQDILGLLTIVPN